MSVQPMETIHHVRGFDCGYGGPFRPLSIANYFQEAAGDHAKILGVGMQNMFSKGWTWMLSRVDIRADRLPVTGDRVTVRTWPAGTNRLFAQRYMELRSESGDLLAGALYEYLVVDIERRRPLRPEKILDPDLRAIVSPPYDDLCAGLHDYPEFAKGQENDFTQAFSIRASPRHMDYNGHVNNAHIVDWLADAVPIEERMTGGIARLKVDFVAELRMGDDVKALSKSIPSSHRHAATLVRDEEIVARASIIWS